MKKRFAHIIPVFFLFFLLLPILCMVALQGAQWYLKNTAGERMQHHRLTTITIPAEKVIWHKQGKEISIEGRLFDIMQYQPYGGTLYATGYFDDEEMSITRLLSLFLPGEKQGNLLHFFLVLQCFMALLVFLTYVFPYRRGRPIDFCFAFHLPLPLCLTEDRPPKC